MIRDLGGVVGVASELSWEVDDVSGHLVGEEIPDPRLTLRPH